MKNFYSTILKLIPKYFKLFLKDVYYAFTGNYITKNCKGDKQNYLNIYDTIINKKYNNIDNFINSNQFKEIDRNFLNNLALISQISIKKSEVNFQHGRLIYSILNNYIKLNRNILNNFLFIDVGTAKGFSSVIISKCAMDNDINYKMYSFDLIPHNKKIFWNSIKDTEGKSSREELLKDYKDYTHNVKYIKGRTKNKFKETSSHERINFAFLDGSHDYDDVKFEFNFIKQKQKKGDIILFDDVTDGHFNGIVKLVNEIYQNQEYEIEKINSSIFRGYAIATKI
jgi:hypothetical protein